MTILLKNNATSRLAAPMLTSDVTLSVLPGEGSKFPALSAGQTFPITVVRADAVLEIMRVTARSADVFTVLRGQEGTTPIDFSVGDRVELRLTEGALNERIDDRIDDKLIPVNQDISDLQTDKAPAVHGHDWADISGQPATYPPIVGTTADTAKAGNYVPDWSEITNKPSTYAPSSHTHAWAQITGAPAYATRWPTWAEVTGKPSTFAPAAHNHPIAWTGTLYSISTAGGGTKTLPAGYVCIGLEIYQGNPTYIYAYRLVATAA